MKRDDEDFKRIGIHWRPGEREQRELWIEEATRDLKRATKLLKRLQAGKITPEDALKQAGELRYFPTPNNGRESWETVWDALH